MSRAFARYEFYREMNSIENVWSITKKEIGNQMLCFKEEMWK